MTELKKSKRKRGWLSKRFYARSRRRKLQALRSQTARIRLRKRVCRTVLIGPVPATIYSSPPLLDILELAKIPALAHLE